MSGNSKLDAYNWLLIGNLESQLKSTEDKTGKKSQQRSKSEVIALTPQILCSLRAQSTILLSHQFSFYYHIPQNVNNTFCFWLKIFFAHFISFCLAFRSVINLLSFRKYRNTALFTRRYRRLANFGHGWYPFKALYVRGWPRKCSLKQCIISY